MWTVESVENGYTTNKVCVCREQGYLQNVRTFFDIETAVQYRNTLNTLSLNLVFLSILKVITCIGKVLKKLTPKISEGINDWEGQNFLKPIFFPKHLMPIYPILYKSRWIVQLLYNGPSKFCHQCRLLF